MGRYQLAAIIGQLAIHADLSWQFVHTAWRLSDLGCWQIQNLIFLR